MSGKIGAINIISSLSRMFIFESIILIVILNEQDIKNGNWWLKYGDNVVGYWPPGLFNELLNATVVQWGGQVVNTQPAGQSTTTQMGSGHFPEEGFGKASYFSRINVVNDRNQLGAPNNILTTVDRSKCYNIRQVRGLFFFGGPGRNPDCP